MIDAKTPRFIVGRNNTERGTGFSHDDGSHVLSGLKPFVFCVSFPHACQRHPFGRSMGFMQMNFYWSRIHCLRIIIGDEYFCKTPLFVEK